MSWGWYNGLVQEKIYITKATGEREVFDPSKLHNSLLRAKASESAISKILSQIELEIKDGATTRDIYDRAFELLNQEHRPTAVRYSLRNAIMDMGPTGFPFELLVAEIFRAKGFEATTDFIAKGKCVEHEIDVVAWNKEKLVMVEAKFHNEFGIKSDLKVVLYVNSRWDDLSETEFYFGGNRKIDEGWLVTNTKFSEQAIKYAECKNMKLVGWNYPYQGNLQDLIEEAELHPITSLKTIGSSEERALMAAGIVLCKQAKDNIDIVRSLGIKEDKIEAMMKEIDLIQN